MTIENKKRKLVSVFVNALAPFAERQIIDMKSIFRYIILIFSSLGLAVLGFNTLPADNLLTDILTEKPEYKIAIIAIIFVGYFVMYLITTLIMSFICCLFFKMATKDKKQFDLKAAQAYSKFSVTLLIALHVICFGVQLFSGYIVYMALYVVVGLLIAWLFTRQYKRKKDSNLNIYVALIPYIAYIIGNISYTYFNF